VAHEFSGHRPTTERLSLTHTLRRHESLLSPVTEATTR
jgi:hypothetical protein